MEAIFQLIVVVFSIVIHEVAHGFMALKLGDNTAQKAGRLTLNPLAHMDPIGSFVLPLLLFFSSGGKFVFGWAKPVPYNPYLLKHPRRDAALLSLAGPLANLSLALIFGLIIRFFYNASQLVTLMPFFGIIVYINLIMAVFNLLPIPPLDGSKILFFFVRNPKFEVEFEKYSIVFILVFLFFGMQFLGIPINYLFRLITGTN